MASLLSAQPIVDQIPIANTMPLLSLWKNRPSVWKKKPRDTEQQRLRRREEKQREEDKLRQTDPNGLLKIALPGSGRRRRSFTAADPARFFRKEGHWTEQER
ncbi:uncharacterized protein LTR77_005398 [Saxophila tyrrhenica]|uniref:Uncharacterized protein n=1 Tax=Saxophila tyrrhenica TaxID=1690608 RepID=A0AAV9P8Y5_9PEZI|nr:hypothetical protein LTR77_005398 [Saxophila tyrrhenica]